MKYYHPRILKLVNLLYQAKKPLTGREIGEKLAIKPRTLREDISRYKKDLAESGVVILSKHGVGYKIVITDEEKFDEIKRALMRVAHDVYYEHPGCYRERVNYLIRIFLSSDDYIKLDKITEDIYVSRSTLNSCMKGVREALGRFDLALTGRPARGIKITGSELSVRQAIAHYFFYHENRPEKEKAGSKLTRRKIREVLLATLEENDLELTDLGFQNLVIHLEIALLRSGVSTGGQIIPSDFLLLKKRHEYAVAQQLVRRLNQVFFVTLPESECCFIAIHLAGKRSLSREILGVTTPDVTMLFDKVIGKIAECFGVNLANDFEFYTLLSLHFIPMLDRLNWNLKIQNPLLQQIKEENTKAFEMAILAGEIIQQETGLAVNEAEIGYMAIHFSLAVEREGNAHKSKIIIVCASGMGSSQLLLYKIRQRFSQSISQIKVVPLYELSQIDQQNYDVILSTVDIPFKTTIPLLRINYFLTPQDVATMGNWLNSNGQRDQLHDYFHRDLFFTTLQSQQRDELIIELCWQVARHVDVGEGFAQRVIEREQLSATEFGNGVAFPHPLYPGGERTFVAVAVLDKPVRWKNKDIRYIFMLNIFPGETKSLDLLYESLITLMCSGDKLKVLQENRNFTTFSALLEQVIRQSKEELSCASCK